MLTQAKWDKAKRLLDEGKTQREIRGATGLARRTIGRIDAGQIPRPSKCRGCRPRRPVRGRCESCGATVDLPCCACCDETTPPGPRPIGEVIEPLTLALTAGDAQRLRDVQARQRRQRRRSDDL